MLNKCSNTLAFNVKISDTRLSKNELRDKQFRWRFIRDSAILGGEKKTQWHRDLDPIVESVVSATSAFQADFRFTQHKAESFDVNCYTINYRSMLAYSIDHHYSLHFNHQLGFNWTLLNFNLSIKLNLIVKRARATEAQLRVNLSLVRRPVMHLLQMAILESLFEMTKCTLTCHKLLRKQKYLRQFQSHCTATFEKGKYLMNFNFVVLPVQSIFIKDISQSRNQHKRLRAPDPHVHREMCE